MKKFKNVAILAVAIILICAISVGGTIAYLAATTGTLINTMVAGEFGNIYLQEVGDDGSQDIKWFTGIGQKYQNDYSVTPGVDINKDPKVKFEFGGEDSVTKAYIFVRIPYTYSKSNGWAFDEDTRTLTAYVNDKVALKATINSDWYIMDATAFDATKGTGEIVLSVANASGKVSSVTKGSSAFAVLTSAGSSVFAKLADGINTIEVSEALELADSKTFYANIDNYNLPFYAYAIQTESFNNHPADAWNAVKDMK